MFWKSLGRALHGCTICAWIKGARVLLCMQAGSHLPVVLRETPAASYRVFWRPLDTSWPAMLAASPPRPPALTQRHSMHSSHSWLIVPSHTSAELSIRRCVHFHVSVHSECIWISTLPLLVSITSCLHVYVVLMHEMKNIHLVTKSLIKYIERKKKKQD